MDHTVRRAIIAEQAGDAGDTFCTNIERRRDAVYAVEWLRPYYIAGSVSMTQRDVEKCLKLATGVVVLYAISVVVSLVTFAITHGHMPGY